MILLPFPQESLPLDLRAETPPALQLRSAEVPPATNAYYRFLVIGRRIPRSLDRLEVHPEWREPLPVSARQFLRLTDAVAGKMDSVLKSHPFQWPVVPIQAWSQSAPSNLLHDMFAVRNLGKLRVLRAQAFASTGKLNDAARELAATMTYGRALTKGEPLAIDYLVGASVEAMGVQGARTLLKKYSVPVAARKTILAAIPRPSLVDPDLALAYRVEFNRFTLPTYESVSFDELKRAADNPFGEEPSTAGLWPVGDADLFDRQATLRLAAQVFLRHVASAGRSWSERDRGIEAFVAKLTADAPRPLAAEDDGRQVGTVEEFRVRAATVPNAFGLYLLAAGPVTDLHGSALRRLVGRELLRTALAVEGRSLPRRLRDALDPATGGPLRYDRARRLVWSAGFNGRDESGKGDDLTAHL